MDKKVKLTPEEKKELERRGFLVKKNFEISKLIEYLFYLIGYISIFMPILGILSVIPGGLLAFLLGNDDFLGYISLGAVFVGVLWPIIDLLRSFIRTGYTFQTPNGRIEYGSIMKKSHTTYSKRHRLFHFVIKIKEFMLGGGAYSSIVVLWISSFLLAIGSIPIFTYSPIIFTYSFQADFITLLYFLFLCAIAGLAPFIVLAGVMIIVRYFFQSLHPLYAFGNLGERIQKLTPEIGKKSKILQENFQHDHNFHTLSQNFDSLATTFREIISLVIQLERIEKKANTGNLFDSEKYINSLRTDIVEPLKSLRTFLEDQRGKLEQSQEELEKVRIKAGGPLDSGIKPEGQIRDPETSSGGLETSSGGLETSSGGLGHGELTSKRTEPLIVELTENIEKLDEMIAKMI